jgi:hypothetical protein
MDVGKVDEMEKVFRRADRRQYGRVSLSKK